MSWPHIAEFAERMHQQMDLRKATKGDWSALEGLLASGACDFEHLMIEAREHLDRAEAAQARGDLPATRAFLASAANYAHLADYQLACQQAAQP